MCSQPLVWPPASSSPWSWAAPPYTRPSSAQQFTVAQCCGTVTIFYDSGSDFWKVTVPVPVPYLDHKKHNFPKNIWKKISPFYIPSFLQGKKLINFIKFIVKCQWKNVKWRKLQIFPVFVTAFVKPFFLWFRNRK
jgi:hypothetical protein